MEQMIDVPVLIMEFLEVAIHSVLYIKKIYPDGIFRLKKKYGVPVHISIYPDLNNYINKTLTAIKSLLDSKDLKEIHICFFSPNSELVERVVICLEKFSDCLNNMQRNDTYLIELGEAFRKFCLKLTVNSHYTKNLPEGTTFKIVVHTTESSSYSLSEDSQHQDFPWIELNKNEVIMSNPTIAPLCTIEHELMTMHIYCEESSEK